MDTTPTVGGAGMTGRRGQHESVGQRWPLNGRSTGLAASTVTEPAIEPVTDTVTDIVAELDHSTVDGEIVDVVAPHYIDVPGYVPDVPADPLLAAGYALRIQRRPVGDTEWAHTLERIARAVVWALPAAVVCVGLATLWGWPKPEREPAGVSPGTWLLVTVLGLLLGLIGVIGLSALLVATRGRRWALAAVAGVVTGTVLLLPVVGVLGLARPAVSRGIVELGRYRANQLDDAFLQGSVARWLSVGGLLLLGVGWIALAAATMACDLFNRLDGWLVLGSVLVAAAGTYVSLPFLRPVAALVLLAATLGIAWSTARYTTEES
jgi:hypothetical protein